MRLNERLRLIAGEICTCWGCPGCNGRSLLELFLRLCGSESYSVGLYRLVSDDGALAEAGCTGIAGCWGRLGLRPRVSGPRGVSYQRVSMIRSSAMTIPLVLDGAFAGGAGIARHDCHAKGLFRSRPLLRARWGSGRQSSKSDFNSTCTLPFRMPGTCRSVKILNFVSWLGNSIVSVGSSFNP